MKLIYSGGKVTFEAEVSNGKAAFELVAKMSELFSGESCGCCKGSNTRPSVRKSGEYTFYELACSDCNAKLSFGQAKEGGGLFVKRWDKETKQALPNRGWSIYQGTGEKKSQAQDADPRDATEAGGEVPF